jgi:signal transduction histidine kinase
MRWFLTALLLVLATAHVAAGERVVERAFFEDQRADMTFEQVQEAPFSKAGKVLSLGYLRGALWLRLTVDAPDQPGPLALQLFPSVLDEVTVFSARDLAEGAPAPAATGRRMTGYRIWIEAKPGSNVVYLRVKTAGLMLVAANLVSQDQAHEDDIERGMVLGAVMACSLPLGLVMFVWILRRRELLHMLFLLNLSVSVAVYLAWYGFLRQIFGDASWFGSSTFVSFLGVINIFTGFLFIGALLVRFDLPRWGKHLFRLFLLLYLPLFLLFFVLDRQTVLNFSTAVGVGASLLGLVLTPLVFRRQKSSTWLIATILFVALLLLLRSLLMVRGLLAPDGSTLYLLVFRIFFFAVFFLTILFLIDRDRKSLMQTALLNATIARSQAESEKRRREAQERFMTMLMHELKTPLAIIGLAATSLGRQLLPASADAKRVKNINNAVEDLHALVERCAEADQVDQGAIRLHQQVFAVKKLTDDVLQALGSDRIRLRGNHAESVFSDYQYVRLILQNLLSNALKYSPAGSVIELSIESSPAAEQASTFFRVLNQVGAAGLPDPAQVFSRYYRSEAAHQQVGAGLGLWLAQALARQLGSEVVFQTPPGQVVFGFRLVQA